MSIILLTAEYVIAQDRSILRTTGSYGSYLSSMRLRVWLGPGVGYLILHGYKFCGAVLPR